MASSPAAAAAAAGAGPMNKIEAAHQMFRDGKYEEALAFYTQALSMVKTKPQKIALHSNRAACFLKLHRFKQAAEECTLVLELDHKHTGALMLRAQTLVTLKEYRSALFDVNRLMELNPSSEVYRNLEASLRTQLSLAPIPESEAELEEEEENVEVELRTDDNGQQEEPITCVGTSQKTKSDGTASNAEAVALKTLSIRESSTQGRDGKSEPRKTIAAEVIAQAQKRKSEPRYATAEFIAQAQRRNTTAEVIAQAQKKAEPRGSTAEIIAQAQRKAEPRTTTGEAIAQSQKAKELSENHPKGWQTIPKPKGHSALDYARWDRVEDGSSDDDDDSDNEEEAQPQYRFRVRTVGVRQVK